MRDGITLYADIFRPIGDVKVPAILNSTTFGKSKAPKGGKGPGAPAPDDNPFSVPGVPKEWTSGLESFESTDPGFFVNNSYAVINLDIRGCYMSEGKGQYFGTQEAEDDYDVIEWLAAQDWSSGKIGMYGGSYSAYVQYAAAILKPPHLVTLIPNISSATPFDNMPYEGGVLLMGGNIRWIDIVEN